MHLVIPAVIALLCAALFAPSTRSHLVVALLVLCGLSASIRISSAQELARPSQEPAGHTGEADDGEEEGRFEGEFIASTVFQGASASFRLRSPLVLESTISASRGTTSAWSASPGPLCGASCASDGPCLVVRRREPPCPRDHSPLVARERTLDDAGTLGPVAQGPPA
jgi:hypothetical protein